MTPSVEACPDHMPIDLLSSWYDHEVSGSIAERVQQHVTTCTACQHYLSGYAQDARSIASYDAPQMQARIWRGVRDEITQARARKTAPRRSVALAALSASLAVVVLAATLVIVFWKHQDSHPVSIAPTVTTATSPTPTTKPLVSPEQGWVAPTQLPATTNKWVAFSQSDPLVGYACGNNKQIDKITPSPTLQFSTTKDGGKTWEAPTAMSIQGDWCAISVNPLNAQDLVLTDYQGLGADFPWHGMYRSHDKGRSWSKLDFPLGEQTYPGAPIWAGLDLFIVTDVPHASGPEEPNQRHHLIVSHNGSPMTTLDEQSFHIKLNISLDTDYQLGSFAIGSNFYMFVARDGVCPTSNCPYAKTSDGGKTWTTIMLDPTIINIVSGRDNKTLFGTRISGTTASPGLQFVSSSDEGATWKELPALSPAQQKVAGTIIVSLADGTVYATPNSTINVQGSDHILKLPPHADTWLAMDTNSNPVTTRSVQSAAFADISLDSADHPTAIWCTQTIDGTLATYPPNSNPRIRNITMVYHAP